MYRITLHAAHGHNKLITGSTGTLHTSNKALFTNVMILVPPSSESVQDGHKNVIICSLASCQLSLKILYKPFGSFCAKLLTEKQQRKLAATLRWFTAGGAIPIAVRQLSQTWKLRHYDVIDDVITRKQTIRDRQKRRPPRDMKSSELSNGENCIALRQLLQNRKLRHL